MRLGGYIFILLLGFNLSGNAQFGRDYSNYLFNGLLINPANTGDQDALTFGVNSRLQWMSFPGAPQTTNVFIHTRLKKEIHSIGFQTVHDKIGERNNLISEFTYSYRVNFKKSKLSFGIGLGPQFAFNQFDNLTSYDTDDPSATNQINKTFINGSFGILWQGKNHFLTYSIPSMVSYNLSNGKAGVSNASLNHLFGGGFKFNVKNWSIKPSSLIQFNVNANALIHLNLLLGYKDLIDFGIVYRVENSLGMILKIKPNNQLQINYGFAQLNIGTLALFTHEFGLQYSLKYQTKSTNPRYLTW